MGIARPTALSIAGYDPSGGAGLLADVKTMEQCRVYGLGVQSALTWQNEKEFEEIRWESAESIISQIRILARIHKVAVAKVGLIRDLGIFRSLLDELERSFPGVKVIWDPVMSASAGFEFHERFDTSLLEKVLKRVYLLTPNQPEAMLLSGKKTAGEGAAYLGKFTNVYLKGGHDGSGRDRLISDDAIYQFRKKDDRALPKHGSGCVFSAAVAAYLARGFKLHPACLRAKRYVHEYLSSTKDLLGYHKR